VPVRRQYRQQKKPNMLKVERVYIKYLTKEAACHSLYQAGKSAFNVYAVVIRLPYLNILAVLAAQSQ
jgi:hypothetical protein